MAGSRADVLDALEGHNEVLSVDDSFIDEERDAMKLEWLRNRIQIVHQFAYAVILFAIISICISSFALACGPCGTKESVGSGIWCPVFFIFLGVMCRGNTDNLHPFKILCIFGIAAIHFAVLMTVIESIEVVIEFGRESINVVAIVMHISLCVIALVEFFMLSLTIHLHKRPNHFHSVKRQENRCIRILPRRLTT